MLHRHDKYPISCARVHGAMGADALHLRVSTGAAHQGAQRAAAELALLNAGGGSAAVRGHVGAAGIVPLGSLPAHPVGAGKSIRRAALIGHRSAPGFAHDADQPFCLRFAAGHFAQQFQGRGGAGDQHVDGAQPMAWLNALFGWARCGERRHLTVTTGGMLLLALTATLTMGV